MASLMTRIKCLYPRLQECVYSISIVAGVIAARVDLDSRDADLIWRSCRITNPLSRVQQLAITADVNELPDW